MLVPLRRGMFRGGDPEVVVVFLHALLNEPFDSHLFVVRRNMNALMGPRGRTFAP